MLWCVQSFVLGNLSASRKSTRIYWPHCSALALSFLPCTFHERKASGRIFPIAMSEWLHPFCFLGMDVPKLKWKIGGFKAWKVFATKMKIDPLTKIKIALNRSCKTYGLPSIARMVSSCVKPCIIFLSHFLVLTASPVMTFIISASQHAAWMTDLI